MATTAQDLLRDECYELAVRQAIKLGFRGDVQPIADALYEAALPLLERRYTDHLQGALFI